MTTCRKGRREEGRKIEIKILTKSPTYECRRRPLRKFGEQIKMPINQSEAAITSTTPLRPVTRIRRFTAQDSNPEEEQKPRNIYRRTIAKLSTMSTYLTINRQAQQPTNQPTYLPPGTDESRRLRMVFFLPELADFFADDSP